MKIILNKATLADSCPFRGDLNNCTACNSPVNSCPECDDDTGELYPPKFCPLLAGPVVVIAEETQP